jgi:hypothetical protein
MYKKGLTIYNESMYCRDSGANFVSKEAFVFALILDLYVDQSQFRSSVFTSDGRLPVIVTFRTAGVTGKAGQSDVIASQRRGITLNGRSSRGPCEKTITKKKIVLLKQSSANGQLTSIE